MSGRKQVLVDSTEYQQLMQRASELQMIRGDLPKLLQDTLLASRSELESRMQTRLRPLEKRDAELLESLRLANATVHSLDERTARELRQQQEQLLEIEKSTAKRLKEQREQVLKAVKTAAGELHQDIDHLRQDTGRMLEDQARQMESLVATEGEQRRAQMANLQQQVDRESAIRLQQVQALQTQIDDAALKIEAQRKLRGREEAFARQRLANCQALLKSVEQGHHQRFAPGVCARLADRLQDLNGQVALAPQGVMVNGQALYRDLDELRLLIEQREQEWVLALQSDLLGIAALEQAAMCARKVEALDHNLQVIVDPESGTAAQVDVDWWTCGALEQLIARIAALKNRLDLASLDDEAGLQTADLQRIATQELPELQSQLGNLVMQARVTILASQQRANTAQLVVAALEEQGFTRQDEAYEGDDTRAGYWMKAQLLNGAEVTVVVRSSVDVPGGYELDISSFDGTLATETALEQRSLAIAEALRDRGWPVPDPRKVGDQPDNGVRDVEQVLQLEVQPVPIPVARQH